MQRAVATVIISMICASAIAAGTRVINADAYYPEGPVWFQDRLYYIEYSRNTVIAWNGSKNKRFASLPGCGPSAIIATKDGQFLVACADNNSVARLRADGTSLPPYIHDRDGNTFVGPNDFASDGHGGIYFSASGNNTAFNEPAAHPNVPIVDGKLFYITSDKTIIQVADAVHGANGLAVSNDGKTLYLAETDERRLQQFTIERDGTLSDQKTFLNTDDLIQRKGHIWPDGLKIDSAGAIYIGQSPRDIRASFVGVIFVVDARGALQRTLKLPSPSVPNLAFSRDEKTVYVTAIDQIDKFPYHGKVYSVQNR